MIKTNPSQSAELTGSPLLAVSYKNPGKKIITKNGCMINFHGIFFFADAKISQRRPWVITIKHGALPNAQEWKRLQDDYRLAPVDLTKTEEKKARKIAEEISGDPMNWLSKEEAAAYVRWRMSPKNKQRQY